jgi:hypothetical protein
MKIIINMISLQIVILQMTIDVVVSNFSNICLTMQDFLKLTQLIFISYYNKTF